MKRHKRGAPASLQSGGQWHDAHKLPGRHHLALAVHGVSGTLAGKMNADPATTHRGARFCWWRSVVTAAWFAGRQSGLGCILLLVGIGSGAAVPSNAPSAQGAKHAAVWRNNGERTVFEVNDREVLKPVHSGRWRLAGELEVRFTGRVQPHENSVFSLFGSGVEAIAGRFDRVLLPAGWRYDLNYDEPARTVTTGGQGVASTPRWVSTSPRTGGC